MTTWRTGLRPGRRGARVEGLAFAVILALSALFVRLPAKAQAPVPAPSLEYSVKAAFLYKFGAFVDWPPTAFDAVTSPFFLCIVGDDPFAPDHQHP